jgi:hypothetical protein
LGAGAATVRQPAGDADVGVDADPPAAVLVAEPAAVLLVVVEVVVELLPQPASPMTIATASHALRTGSEQSRSPHFELLMLPKLSVEPWPAPGPGLLLLLIAPEPPPGGGGGVAGWSNVWVVVPLAVVSSADLTACELGHQATNQPWPTVAWTLVPSSRVSVTPVTSEPVRPSATE